MNYELSIEVEDQAYNPRLVRLKIKALGTLAQSMGCEFWPGFKHLSIIDKPRMQKSLE